MDPCDGGGGGRNGGGGQGVAVDWAGEEWDSLGWRWAGVVWCSQVSSICVHTTLQRHALEQTQCVNF